MSVSTRSSPEQMSQPSGTVSMSASARSSEPPHTSQPFGHRIHVGVHAVVGPGTDVEAIANSVHVGVDVVGARARDRCRRRRRRRPNLRWRRRRRTHRKRPAPCPCRYRWRRRRRGRCRNHPVRRPCPCIHRVVPAVADITGVGHAVHVGVRGVVAGALVAGVRDAVHVACPSCRPLRGTRRTHRERHRCRRP